MVAVDVKHHVYLLESCWSFVQKNLPGVTSYGHISPLGVGDFYCVENFRQLARFKFHVDDGTDNLCDFTFVHNATFPS